MSMACRSITGLISKSKSRGRDCTAILIATRAVMSLAMTINAPYSKDRCWLCSGGARADIIDTEHLKKLKKTGCFQIFYGLESGSQKMLDLMKKCITVEQNRRAVVATRDAGLHCVPQFVLGLPGEDRGTLSETLNFVKSVDFWSYTSPPVISVGKRSGVN